MMAEKTAQRDFSRKQFERKKAFIGDNGFFVG
jgi:hypothetical protein